MSFEPITITLRTPLKHGPETIEKLVFGREMCAGDLRGGIDIGQPTYDHIRTVASRITGVPDPVLKDLPWHDFSQVVSVVMGFFTDTPLIGEKE